MLNDAEKDKVVRRIHRIKGQIEGIEKMVEDKRYCIEVLQQIGAVRSALYQVGLLMLESHSRFYVVDAIRKGKEEDAISELMGVFKALHK